MAALGGAMTSGSPRFQDFRRSEDIEDRRKQKYSQNPSIYEHDWAERELQRIMLNTPDPADEKSSLGRTLGIIDLIKADVDRTK